MAGGQAYLVFRRQGGSTYGPDLIAERRGTAGTSLEGGNIKNAAGRAFVGRGDCGGCGCSFDGYFDTGTDICCRKPGGGGWFGGRGCGRGPGCVGSMAGYRSYRWSLPTDLIQ